MDNNALDEFREKLITGRWEFHPEELDFMYSQGELILTDEQVDSIYNWAIKLVKQHI